MANEPRFPVHNSVGGGCIRMGVEMGVIQQVLQNRHK